MEDVDILAESPYHPVYQFAEVVDETAKKLQLIKCRQRSSKEEKFIDFITGRRYNKGSRSTVLDAVVPHPGGPKMIWIL